MTGGSAKEAVLAAGVVRPLLLLVDFKHFIFVNDCIGYYNNRPNHQGIYH